MAQLRQAYSEFVERECEVLAVGPDRAAVFKAYWAAHGFPFPGLPDPRHEVARRYAQEVKLLKFGRMPALFIVDKKGLVRFAHYAENMRDYPELKELFATLDALRREEEAAKRAA